MRIEMLQRDVKGGRGSAWACPVARAIGRALGGETAVTGLRVLVSIPGSPHLITTLSAKARRWVILYDHDLVRRKRGRPLLRPIAFDLPELNPFTTGASDA
jgi:hypothetical protein